MSNTEISKLQKKVNRKKVDLGGWEYVCTFGNCLVYAKGDERCLIKAETGEVVLKYSVGIHGVKLEKNGLKTNRKR